MFKIVGEHEDDYILFDCPGQIELYTHLTAMKKLVKQLQNWNFNVCSVFLVDVQFMTDGAKFLSGVVTFSLFFIYLFFTKIGKLHRNNGSTECYGQFGIAPCKYFVKNGLVK